MISGRVISTANLLKDLLKAKSLLPLLFVSVAAARPETESVPTDVAPPPWTYALFVQYAPLDLLIPGKIGVTTRMSRSSEAAFELEYLQGRFSAPFFIDDLGSMTDRRISVVKRSFRGRFNVHYGVTHFSFDARLGGGYLQYVTPAARERDVVSARSLGIVAGIGHRWALGDRVLVGIDWISWAQPLFTIERDDIVTSHMTDSSARDRIEKTVGLVMSTPRLSVLKAHIGYQF